MNFRGLILTGLLAFFLATACGPSATQRATQIIEENPVDMDSSPPASHTISPEINAPPEGDPARVYEEQGGFSYIPPDSWQVIRTPDTNYKVVFGPTEGRFPPNINFVDGQFSGSLDESIAFNIFDLKQEIRGIQILSLEDFQSDSGPLAGKLITESVQANVNLRQIFYFFNIDDRLIIATCTRLVDQSPLLDAQFDEIMRSFRGEEI